MQELDIKYNVTPKLTDPENIQPNTIRLIWYSDQISVMQINK